MDVRVLRLGKWNIPKTNLTIKGTGEDVQYHTIGYFDFMEVVSDQNDEAKLHPWETAYSSFVKTKGTKSEEYSMQEIMLFTNKKCGPVEPEKFWKCNSLWLFVSLIHVDLGIQVEHVIKKINDIFETKTFICYYSFDYSGIVLFAKNMEIKDFLNAIYNINYQDEEEGKLVRDSYSFYGYNKKKLKLEFENIKKNSNIENSEYENELDVSVNVGVQQYSVFTEFCEKLTADKIKYKTYRMFGRHDISLVMEKMKEIDFIRVQYWLDYYTQLKENLTINNVLGMYESFIKIEPDIAFVKNLQPETRETNEKDELDKGRNNFATKVTEILTKKKEEYKNSIEKSAMKDKGEYMIAVETTFLSVHSVLKNGFGECFILCMIESFVSFMDFLIEYLKEGKTKEFDECFNLYFIALNSLINSAMHMERQFIQITSFNAAFYDIPPKIMAFYVAEIYNIKNIIGNEQDKKYTCSYTHLRRRRCGLDYHTSRSD